MRPEAKLHVSLIKKIVFLVPLGALTLSSILNIITAASVSDVGAKIHDYESKAAVLSAHSDELMTELASKQSLAVIKAWADTAGFVPRTQVAIVKPEAPKLAMGN